MELDAKFIGKKKIIEKFPQIIARVLSKRNEQEAGVGAVAKSIESQPHVHRSGGRRGRRGAQCPAEDSLASHRKIQAEKYIAIG